MKVVVTGGPAVTPIDAVRRITNRSTGELSVLLANAFAAARHEVVCLMSEAATTGLGLDPAVNTWTFATNADLLDLLDRVKAADVVLHAAALSDFEVAEVCDGAGRVMNGAKLSSRVGDLVIRLRPASKVIGELRLRFPKALIVGWKYELVGSRNDALQAARRQLMESRTDACVVNGAAFGAGFGLLEPRGELKEYDDKVDLAAGLVGWIAGRGEGKEESPESV